MSRQTNADFLRSLGGYAAVTDKEYLRFDIEVRDRLCRLADLGEDFWPDLSWCPSHRELMPLLEKANQALVAKTAAAVAKKLTS